MPTSRRKVLFVALALLVVLALAAPEPALAAPGGVIKQAARSTLGKIVLGAVILLFLPLIVWRLIQRAILVRRARTALKRLGAQVPHFAWPPLKERICEVFGWVHSAWDQGKMELAGGYMTAWYTRNQQLQLDKWERDGLQNVSSDVKIKALVPLYASHDPQAPNHDRIVVEIEAEMRDYLVEKATGKVVKGDKTLGTTTTIWTFVRENGTWVLSNIEPDDLSLEYLKEADPILTPQAKPAA